MNHVLFKRGNVGLAWYRLRDDFEGELRARLLEAASLLRRHGWVVRPPTPSE